MTVLARFRPDGFMLAMAATVLAASFAPIADAGQGALETCTQWVVAPVFFLHGARLPRAAVARGMANWRLHLAVLAASFVVFPILGLGATRLGGALLGPALSSGVLFLCCLSSTMQASVAFTAIARGNVAAAVCSASLSNLLGVFATPLLVTLVLGAKAGVSPGSIEHIVIRILAPFVAGQILHPWLGRWTADNPRLLGLVDRGSILLVVYAAFGDAVKAGLWHTLTPVTLSAMLGISAVLLASVLAITWYGAAWLGFDRADRTAVLFCGSKKSLISGVPMANILFPGPSVGMILLPLMVFHQIQLMACALLARRLSELDEVPAAGALQPAE
jgi:sodium/bile acid cotransporter 7